MCNPQYRRRSERKRAEMAALGVERHLLFLSRRLTQKIMRCLASHLFFAYFCTMSYTHLVYHIVWRTYRSLPAINEEHERQLYAYIYGYVTKHKATLIRLGGMPDHIHMLISIPPDVAVSEFMKGLKFATSTWLKQNPDFPLFSGWGEGYAAFTYSKDQIPVVKQYIMNQKEHHKVTTFAEEYRKFIIDNGGTIDERFFLKD